MKSDGGKSAVKKISKFLNVNCNESQVNEICEKCSFTSMKKVNNEHGFVNELIEEKGNQVWSDESEGTKAKFSNAHIRKGTVGDWTNYYSEEQLSEWKQYLEIKLKAYPNITNYVHQSGI